MRTKKSVVKNAGKAGPGRPPGQSSTRPISIRFPVNALEELQRNAVAMRLPLALFIRNIVLSWLDEQPEEQQETPA